MDIIRVSMLAATCSVLLACGTDERQQTSLPDSTAPLSTPEDVIRRMYSGWFAEQLPQQTGVTTAKALAIRGDIARSLQDDSRPGYGLRAKSTASCSGGSKEQTDSEIEIDPMLGGTMATLQARSTHYDDCVSYAGGSSAPDSRIQISEAGTETIACDATSRPGALDSECDGGPYRYIRRGSQGEAYVYTETTTGADGALRSTSYRSDDYYQHRERIQNADGGYGYEVFYYSSGSTTYRRDGVDYYLGHRIGKKDDPMHYSYLISDRTEPSLDSDGVTQQYSYSIAWNLFGHDSSSRSTCSYEGYEVSTLVPVVSQITVTYDPTSGASQYRATPQSGLVEYEQDGARATLEFLGDGVIRIVDSTGRTTVYRDPQSVLAAAGDCGPAFPAD